MLIKQKEIFWLLLVVLALGFSVFAFTSIHRSFGPRRNGVQLSIHTPQTLTTTTRGTYVRRGLLRSQLVWNLNAFGDRLEKPGMERLTVAGTLTRSGDLQPWVFVIIAEFPDRLRCTLQQGIQSRVLTFDGQQAQALGDPLNANERDLIETLIYDTAEHLFTSQMSGQATRSLGNRFRIDDGSSANYSGPYYDIYQVSEQVKTSADQSQKSRLYYFNSDTQLLDRVRYQIGRNGLALEIETKISRWQKESGQQVPRRVERLAQGKSVFVLDVQSVAFSPHVDDGIFTITNIN